MPCMLYSWLHSNDFESCQVMIYPCDQCKEHRQTTRITLISDKIEKFGKRREVKMDREAFPAAKQRTTDTAANQQRAD